MKIKKRKFISKLKLIKLIKKKFLPICFTVLTSISICLNNGKNNCEAINENLYNYLNQISQDGVDIINESNQIEKIDFNDYLMGVIIGECYINDKDAAIIAQILAIKNYVCFHLCEYLKNNNGKIKPVPINTNFQVYLNDEKRRKKLGKEYDKYKQKIQNLIDSVKDIYIFVNNNKKNSSNNSKEEVELLANTTYFSKSSEKTESAKNAWGGNDISYLVPVDSSFEKPEEKKFQFNYEDLFNKIKLKNNNITKPNKKEDAIKIISKTDSDRVKNVNIFNVDMTAIELQKILNLPSTCFSVEFENDNVNFKCKGEGHGVGMSQNGARILAAQGKNFEEIIKHYYTGVKIKNINQLKNN